MGKQRDLSSADTAAQEYRRRLGKQEFRGRSKKNAMKARNIAQAKKTNADYLKDVVLSLAAIAVVVAMLYLGILYSLQR